MAESAVIGLWGVLDYTVRSEPFKREFGEAVQEKITCPRQG